MLQEKVFFEVLLHLQADNTRDEVRPLRVIHILFGETRLGGTRVIF